MYSTQFFSRKNTRPILCAGLLVTLASQSYGATLTVSDPFLRVTATNAQGSGTFSVPFPDPNIDSIVDPSFTGWGWSLTSIGGPVDIMDGPTRIGTITNLVAQVWREVLGNGDVEHRINLVYTVVSGNVDTQFSVLSPMFSFKALPDQIGNASAGMTLTDQNFNGSSLSGDFANNASFNARYNTSTDFALLRTNDLSTGAGGSANDPPVNVQEVFAGPALVPVVNMQSEFRFTLSAFDSSGGTSTYVFVPSPGSISLLALGGLTFLRRRRS